MYPFEICAASSLACPSLLSGAIHPTVRTYLGRISVSSIDRDPVSGIFEFM
jgi:hypothetical protein